MPRALIQEGFIGSRFPRLGKLALKPLHPAVTDVARMVPKLIAQRAPCVHCVHRFSTPPAAGAAPLLPDNLQPESTAAQTLAPP